jgi:hypothetical protein
MLTTKTKPCANGQLFVCLTIKLNWVPLMEVTKSLVSLVRKRSISGYSNNDVIMEVLALYILPRHRSVHDTYSSVSSSFIQPLRTNIKVLRKQ